MPLLDHANATSRVVAASSTEIDARTCTWDKANNKTQRVEWDAATALKTYDYQYDSLNWLIRSTKTIGAVAPGTAMGTGARMPPYRSSYRAASR